MSAWAGQGERKISGLAKPAAISQEGQAQNIGNDDDVNVKFRSPTLSPNTWFFFCLGSGFLDIPATLL